MRKISEIPVEELRNMNGRRIRSTSSGRRGTLISVNPSKHGWNDPEVEILFDGRSDPSVWFHSNDASVILDD